MKLRLKRSPLMAFVYGPLLAALLLGLAFLVMNQPQCPDHFTQEQINTSNCTVGANIGLGLVVFTAPFVVIGSTVVMMGFMMGGKKVMPPEDQASVEA